MGLKKIIEDKKKKEEERIANRPSMKCPKCKEEMESCGSGASPGVACVNLECEFCGIIREMFIYSY